MMQPQKRIYRPVLILFKEHGKPSGKISHLTFKHQQQDFKLNSKSSTAPLSVSYYKITMSLTTDTGCLSI